MKTTMQKFLLVTTAIFLLAAACGKQAQVQPAQPAPQPQAQTQPTDETANWKTYTNAKYGFEFKYPNDWVNQDNDFGAFVHPTDDYLNPRGEGRMVMGMNFSVQPQKDFFANNDVYKKGVTSLVQYVEVYSKVQDAYGFGSYKNITLNGYDAIAVETGGMDSGTDILLSYSGSIYDISLSNDASVNLDSFGLGELESKILSTFKFSNPSDPVVGRICGGGAMANSGACPTGYTCKIDKQGPPAEGTCVKN